MTVRANIHLDEHAYSFASAYARAKGLPLGAAVSELLRQRAEYTPQASASTSQRLTTSAHGLLVLAKTGKVITAEMVKEGSEDGDD